MHANMKLGLAPVLEIRRAETVLHDVARQLARVPPRGLARELHLRALGYKRAISTWAHETPERAVGEGTTFVMPLSGLGIHNFYLRVRVRIDKAIEPGP